MSNIPPTDFAELNETTATDTAAAAAIRMAKMQKLKETGLSIGKALGFMTVGAVLTVGYSRFKNRNLAGGSDIMGVPES